MKSINNTTTSKRLLDFKTKLCADRLAQIGKLTIGALTGVAILFLIHFSNH